MIKLANLLTTEVLLVLYAPNLGIHVILVPYMKFWSISYHFDLRSVCHTLDMDVHKVGIFMNHYGAIKLSRKLEWLT